MSSAAVSSSSLTQYRAAILIAGVSAAYAIYYIHQSYSSSLSLRQPQGNLQRHGAVRRRHSRRPRIQESASAEEARSRVNQAIQRLQEREDARDPYELATPPSFIIPDNIVFEMLPSGIPSITYIQEQSSLSPEDATSLRSRMEDVVADRFLQEAYAGRVIGSIEEEYLREALSIRGIGDEVITSCINRHNNLNRHIDQDSISRPVARDGEAAHNSDEWVPAEEVLALGPDDIIDGQRDETIADDEESDEDLPFNGANERDGGSQAQGLQNLVYNIAKEQAVREGYVHRGVSCNSCGQLPIRGIRYRCANCNDYDLCEDCEAAQVHTKTHLFFKIRIPAPFLGNGLGNGRPALPVWYPGKPNQMVRNIPKSLAARLREENDLESQDIDALWDQFSCLAATEWAEDPNELGMAIDRKTFDKCFVPATSFRPPPPNLLYDRMFAFYDTNGDGLMGFEEFVSGIACQTNPTRDEKLKRIFSGYDLDGDGYVSRKDFLRLFRAWFVVQKELTRDAIAGIEDEFFTDGGVKEIIMSSQPISSAFPGPIPEGIPSRPGLGKNSNVDGDLTIADGQGALRNDIDPAGDRFEIVADTNRPRSDSNPLDDSFPHAIPTRSWQRHGSTSQDSVSDSNPQVVDWPPDESGLRSLDIIEALGKDIPIEEITDPVDRARVISAMETRLDLERSKDIERDRKAIVQERWRRRDFYTDEEEGTSAPPGYHEQDSSDDEESHATDDHISSVSDSQPQTPRSRSSSKVRFEDSITDAELETRSNTSSRSIPVGERWGGYELAEPEQDVGKDILYLAVQEAFNEMLNDLFKEKEDLAMAAKETRQMRELFKDQILQYEERQASQPKPKALRERKARELKPSEKTLDELFQESGYSRRDSPPTEDEPQSFLYGSESPSEQDITPQESVSPDDNRNDSYDDSIDIPHPSVWPALPTVSASQEIEIRPSDVVRRHRTSTASPLHQVENASPVEESSNISPRDPTMPQFRPDTPIPEISPGRSPNDKALARLEDKSSSTPPIVTPPSSESHLNPRDLPIYLQHSAYEREVEARGGKEGTLSYEEFIQKMVGSRAVSPFSQQPTHIKKDLEELIGAGDLSRLGFVGSWIEMASF